MTPQEALQILDQAASAAQLDRRSHVAVQEAVTTLREALLAMQQDGAKPVVPAEETTTE